MNSDGTELRQLSDGPNDDMPSVTADGEWVIYRKGTSIAKVPINGGKSITVMEMATFNPVVSPDGKLLALFTADKLDSEKWHLQVFDLGTLASVKRFDLPDATDPQGSLRWTPSGDGLSYISNADSTSNIWLQPLNNTSPRRLTDFREAEIQSFSWSSDGRQLICVRRAKTYVPVLVRLF
jgi:Tol biopolymer transport system component